MYASLNILLYRIVTQVLFLGLVLSVMNSCGISEWVRNPFGDDEDVRGDGNHTILALLGLKNFNTVKTLRVSREFCEKYNLNLEELRQIGLKMNPRQVVARRETEDEDVIKQLLGLLEGVTDIKPSKTE